MLLDLRCRGSRSVWKGSARFEKTESENSIWFGKIVLLINTYIFLVDRKSIT
jgi:hypothetical protein